MGFRCCESLGASRVSIFRRGLGSYSVRQQALPGTSALCFFFMIQAYTYIYTHTYIYIYMYLCVCTWVYM